jgi:hypothetical protein
VQKLTDHILSGRLKSRYDSNELQRLATGKQLNLREQLEKLRDIKMYSALKQGAIIPKEKEKKNMTKW